MFHVFVSHINGCLRDQFNMRHRANKSVGYKSLYFAEPRVGAFVYWNVYCFEIKHLKGNFQHIITNC